jgi:hypothetical protein
VRCDRDDPGLAEKLSKRGVPYGFHGRGR